MLWYRRYLASGRRNCQEAENAAPADIVDAREHHVIALDFHHDRRGQTLAVELAERHREVGRMAVPADREVGAERDLRGTLRTAHRDLPFASARRRFLPFEEFLAQA